MPFKLFDMFRRRTPSPEEQKKLREQLHDQLQRSLIEAGAQRMLARDASLRACEMARKAIAENNNYDRAVAVNQLRFHFARYRYLGALHGSLRMMDANLTMRGLTEDFANLVHNVSKIRLPSDNLDFNKLTAEALRGLQPIDFKGMEDMAAKLIEGSFSASNIATIPEDYLMGLINGTVQLDDLEREIPVTASPLQTEDQSAPAAGTTATATTATAAANNNMEAQFLQDIMDYLYQ